MLAEGGLVEVTGIKTQDDSTCSIFAALVGCARFIRDCRQVGAGPTKAGPASRRANVRFECAPGAGANDGFLFLRVVTRNGVGIAAGSELVADFGPEYTTVKAGEGSLQKKFKGTLETLFQSQTKMDSQPTTPPAATPAVTPTAATPAVKPPAATPAMTPPNPAPGATNAESAKPAAGLPKIKPAGGWCGTVFSESVPKGGVHLGFAKDGRMHLGPPDGSSANQKVKPKTVLHAFLKGRCDEPSGSEAPEADAQFHWAFPNVKKVQVFYKDPAGNDGEWIHTSLKDLIEQYKVDRLYQHNKFQVAGEIPSAGLSMKKRAQYLADGESAQLFARAAKALKTSEFLELTWAVIVTPAAGGVGGSIHPQGVLVNNRKQVIVPWHETKAARAGVATWQRPWRAPFLADLAA